MMKKIFYICTVSVLFLSCSIKYDTTVEVSDVVPEFVFEDAALSRFENKKIKAQVEAEMLEEYKDSSETFAKGVAFSSYDDKSKVTTEGLCGFLYADTDKKIYELYDNIELNSVSEQTKFFADVIKWNEKTEQLTSGKSDMVRIEKKDTVMFGSGFSASGVSKTFSFTGSVSGDIVTKESDAEDSGEVKD